VTARRVDAAGLAIAFDDLGRGGRPLVLVHGFTGYRGDFAPQAEGLARLGRVLVPDLPGHGESARASSYSLAELARVLGAWLDALELPRVDLLGHSMGGMLALRVALAEPARVASLVLMSTSAQPLAQLDKAVFALGARVARESGTEALFAALRARAVQDPDRGEADRRLEREWGPERFWRWRRERIVALDPEAFAALGPALVEAEPLEGRLREIRCPTLVLVGALDRDFLAPSDVLARGIPGARLVVIPGAGHQPQLETPAAWLAALREHLVRVRGPATLGEAGGGEG
jgi:2-succinyl-6-hydroxy-2,4-cyclohexadiene-1-carboxylate synthase